MAKISIITVAFNSARTIADTFESVLAQNYHDYEYIVIDGGSRDGTLDIIESYSSRFGGRMKWVSEPDCGIYDAMNKGIALASGEVIGILNSDDFYSSADILDTVAEGFESYPDIDALYADVHYVDENDTSKTVRYYSSKVFRRELMRYGFMPAHPSFYCRKSVYERFRLDGSGIEGFRGNPDIAYFNTTYKVAADFDLLLRMISIGNIKLRYIPKDFVTMRTGGASSSGLRSHLQINKDHLRAFKENNIHSNLLLLSFRYVYKVCEIILSRFIISSYHDR